MAQAISYDPYYGASKIRDTKNQREAVTGRNFLTPEELSTLVQSELAVQATNTRQMDQFNQEMALKKSALKDQKQAAMVKGATDLVTTGLGAAALTGPKGLGLWGMSKAITPTATSAAVNAVPAGATVAGSTAGTVAGSEEAAWAAFSGGEAGVLGGAATGAVTAAEATAAMQAAGYSAAEIEAALASGGFEAGGAGIGAGAAGALGYAVPLAFGAGIGMIDDTKIPGRDLGEAGIGIAGGAAIGTAILPGVGTVIGGILGGIGSLVDDVSVLCTELNRQGYLPNSLLMYSQVYRVAAVPEDAYRGYRTIADKLVPKMQKSLWVTMLLMPFIVAYCNEAASRVDPARGGSNWLGKLVHAVGVPVCRLTARLKGVK